MVITKETQAFIAKYLSGNATPEEAMAFNELMNENSSLKEYVYQIESRLPSGISQDRISFYKELIRPEIISHNQILIRRTIYKVAAVFVMLILSVSYIYFNKTQPNKIQIAKTHDKNRSIAMVDQTSLTLNRYSKLQWDDTYNVKNRNMTLRGEAYFEVTHSSTKPFILEVGELQIQVLGTAFNVLEDTLSNRVTVSVTKGKVLMKDNYSQIIVEADMRGIYEQKTKQLTLEGFFNKNDIAYATHSITFSAANFKEVAKQLNKAYGINCVFNDSDFRNCSLTTQWENKSLPFVLNIISEALKIQYKQEADHVYFYGNGCK